MDTLCLFRLKPTFLNDTMAVQWTWWVPPSEPHFSPCRYSFLDWSSEAWITSSTKAKGEEPRSARAEGKGLARLLRVSCGLHEGFRHPFPHKARSVLANPWGLNKPAFSSAHFLQQYSLAKDGVTSLLLDITSSCLLGELPPLSCRDPSGEFFPSESHWTFSCWVFFFLRRIFQLE